MNHLEEEVLNEMQVVCIVGTEILLEEEETQRKRGAMEGPVTFPWLSSPDLTSSPNPAHSAWSPAVYLEICLSSLRVQSCHLRSEEGAIEERKSRTGFATWSCRMMVLCGPGLSAQLHSYR